ncbi:MAG: zf-HC2 domain-containing protein [Bacteroidia bacterium]
MNGPAHQLFDPQTACLTEQAMFEYIDGNLTPSECHAVEKHLLDCAFCSEAMEGLELVKDRTKVSGFLIPVTPVKEEDNVIKGRIIPLNFNARLAAAAIIVLLIGSFMMLRYFLPENKKPDMAQEMDKKLPAKETTVNESNTTVSSAPEDETFYRNFEPYPVSADKVPAKKPAFTPEVSDKSVPPPASPPMGGASWGSGTFASKQDAGPEEKLKGKEEKENHALQQETVITSALKVSKNKEGDALNDDEKTARKQRSVVNTKNSSTDSLSKSSPPPATPDRYDENAVVREELSKSAKYEAKSVPAAVTHESMPASEKKSKKHRSNTTPAQKDQDSQTAPAKAPENRYFKQIEQDSGSLADSTRSIVTIKGNEAGTKSSAMNFHKEQANPASSGEQAKAQINVITPATQGVITTGGTSDGSYRNLQDKRGTVQDKIAGDAPAIGNKKSSVMDEAMEAYRKNDFTLAASRFESVLAGNQGNITALFYAGVSYLSKQTPDTQKALQCFDKVIVSNNAEYSEAASWYKALALIKEKKEDDAKVLLEKMSRKQGAYKMKSEKVLKEMETEKKK